jgi:multicomponent Na+:H+ antiporter subunit C
VSLFASVFVAVAVGAGTWLLLRRNLFEIILGVALLSQGANVLVLASAGYRAQARPPLLASELTETRVEAPRPPSGEYADPLPQALVLTAIVIGFGLLSFLMLLVARGFETRGTLAPDEAPSEAEK